MSLSVRLSKEKDMEIARIAASQGKSKSVVVLESIDKALGLNRKRADQIRALSGWMSKKEAAEFRKHLEIFEEIERGE